MTNPAPNNNAPLMLVERIEQSQSLVTLLGGDKVSADRFKGIVVAAIRRNPDLQRCNPKSVIEACEMAAKDNLVLDGREAALVIYNTRDHGPVAQYVPMFQGLLKRVYRSQQVSSLQAYLVYEEELKQNRFDYIAGDDERIIHNPIIIGPKGKIVAVYTIVTMRDGSKSREVMSVEEVIRAAKASRKNYDQQTGQLKGIWKDHFGEMAKKTCIRRHSKKLPLDADTAAFLQQVDATSYEDEDGQAGEAEVMVPEDVPNTAYARPRGAARQRLQEAGPTIDGTTGEVLEGEPLQPQARSGRPGRASQAHPKAQQTRRRAAPPPPQDDDQGDLGSFDGDGYGGDDDPPYTGDTI